MAVVGVTVVFHLVGLIVRASRVVHDHDERTVEGVSDDFLIKRLRGVLLRLAKGLAILVAESIGELRGRFAKCQHEHVIDGGQHLGLCLFQVGSLLTLCHHVAQLKTELTQLGVEQP